MINNSFAGAEKWLAFELNILRRLKFSSIILPSGGEAKLGAHLKSWNVQIQTNDFLQSDLICSQAQIENNNLTLTAEDIALVLEDAYIPRYRLQNSRLKNWFGETDGWWFDNIRQNIENLSSPVAKAIALKIGMNVGDYALSFTEKTRELRQPLSKVFEKLCSIEPKPFNNNQKNSCVSKPISDFVAESYTDLMFLRLPQTHSALSEKSFDSSVQREEWIRGSADFWDDLETFRAGKFGSRVESKTQYLQLLENILQTASHIPHWAIAHIESNFITVQDVAETINRVRRVETIFTKDFSELTRHKAVIISA